MWLKGKGAASGIANWTDESRVVHGQVQSTMKACNKGLGILLGTPHQLYIWAKLPALHKRQQTRHMYQHTHPRAEGCASESSLLPFLRGFNGRNAYAGLWISVVYTHDSARWHATVLSWNGVCCVPCTRLSAAIIRHSVLKKSFWTSAKQDLFQAPHAPFVTLQYTSLLEKVARSLWTKNGKD